MVTKISLVSLAREGKKLEFEARRNDGGIRLLPPTSCLRFFSRSEGKSSFFFFSIAKQKKKEYGEYLAKFRHDETNTKSIFQRELNAFVA